MATAQRRNADGKRSLDAPPTSEARRRSDDSAMYRDGVDKRLSLECGATAEAIVNGQ
jgi:hypothetical protein